MENLTQTAYALKTDRPKISEEQWERIRTMSDERRIELATLTCLSIELSDVMRGWSQYRKMTMMDIIKDQVCEPE